MTPPPDDGGGGGSSGASSQQSIPLLRPQPQRHWQITPLSTEPPTPRSPSVDGADGDKGGATSVPRSRSILNLTSSTLFGIYRGDDATSSQPPTPWGQGALTPATPASPRESISEESSTRRPVLGAAAVDPAAFRSPPKCTTSRRAPLLQAPPPRRRAPAVTLGGLGALAALGALYGLALARLHAAATIIPVRLAVLEQHPALHLAFWALAAAGAGVALPALDRWWLQAASSSGGSAGSSAGRSSTSSASGSPSGSASPREREHGETMISVMRCVGGFVGIAFAIRKLPCEATLQAALTLTLSNPILWYLIDGSAPGLLLALATGTGGAAVVAGVQPAFDAPFRSPSSAGSSSSYSGWSTAAAGNANATGTPLPGLFGATFPPEVLALAAYVGTALFYCVVCFGNVGRALVYR